MKNNPGFVVSIVRHFRCENKIIQFNDLKRSNLTMRVVGFNQRFSNFLILSDEFIFSRKTNSLVIVNQNKRNFS